MIWIRRALLGTLAAIITIVSLSLMERSMLVKASNFLHSDYLGVNGGNFGGKMLLSVWVFAMVSVLLNELYLTFLYREE